MKVALIQMNSGEDKEDNKHRAIQYLELAIKNNSKFILFPEYFLFRSQIASFKNISDIAETLPGPLIKPFLEIAKREKVYILLGSVYELAKGSPKVYNTSVLIGPNGKIQSIYRKQNLFCANINGKIQCENKFCIAGNQNSIARIGRYSVGMSICFDLRFSSIYSTYAQKGVHVNVVPSAFIYETGRVHWEILLRARAVETLSYILAPNQVGKSERGTQYWGNSMVIDPWGNIIAKASENHEEVLYSSVDMSIIHMYRKVFPTLKRGNNRGRC